MKVKFRAPRTCSKTRNIPGSRWINYPLTEEWEVALDDLCDLVFQTRKARIFLAEWIQSAPQDQNGETEESFTAISACRIGRALDYLLHAESELAAAFLCEQEVALLRFQKTGKRLVEYSKELYSQMGDEDKKRAQLSPAKARRFKGKRATGTNEPETA